MIGLLRKKQNMFIQSAVILFLASIERFNEPNKPLRYIGLLMASDGGTDGRAASQPYRS